MKFICQKCKSTVSDSANFCNHCGSEFKPLSDASEYPAVSKKVQKLIKDIQDYYKKEKDYLSSAGYSSKVADPEPKDFRAMVTIECDKGDELFSKHSAAVEGLARNHGFRKPLVWKYQDDDYAYWLDFQASGIK